MRWSLRFSRRAVKELGKIDRSQRIIIERWLKKNIDGCEDPRAHGKGLSGDRSGQWRYRVGGYRVICEIMDDRLVVLAIEVGHRREIYL